MSLLPRRLRHGEEATLVEHLGELRARLIICLVAITVAFAVTYAFHGRLLDWLNRPLPADKRPPITFGVLEPFTVSIMVSFYAACLIALPIIFWQVWAFLAPAFDERYQRSMSVLVAVRGGARDRAASRSATGSCCRPRVHFLTNYDSAHFDILIRARDYYAFTSLLLLAVALAFEVPVFVLGLVRLRIVSAANLRHGWRVGIFAMTVLGVLLPGVDPVSTGALGARARHAVRALDRAGLVLRAALARLSRAGGCDDRCLRRAVWLRLVASIGALALGVAAVAIVAVLAHRTPGPAGATNAPVGASAEPTATTATTPQTGEPAFPAPPKGAVVFSRPAGDEVLALGVVPGKRLQLQASVLGGQGKGVGGTRRLVRRRRQDAARRPVRRRAATARRRSPSKVPEAIDVRVVRRRSR